jgi:hypothetical protein
MTRGGLFPFFITIRRHSSTHPLCLRAAVIYGIYSQRTAISAKYISMQYRDLKSLSLPLSAFEIRKMSAKLCLLTQKKESSSFEGEKGT